MTFGFLNPFVQSRWKERARQWDQQHGLGRKKPAAIAMEAAKPTRRETGSTEGDSAGPKDIAQPKETP